MAIGTAAMSSENLGWNGIALSALERERARAMTLVLPKI